MTPGSDCRGAGAARAFIFKWKEYGTPQNYSKSVKLIQKITLLPSF